MKRPLLSPLALLLCLVVPGAAQAAGRRVFTDSIRAVAGTDAAEARVARRELRADELLAPLVVSVSLRMRDPAGLQARLEAGERISQDEMEARYLPRAADYDRVSAWLAGQGLAIVQTDRNHTIVAARGSVALVAQAFALTFARVAVPAEASSTINEYTAAIDAPSLPEDLAPAILGIDGLQPYLRLRHIRARPLDVVGNSSFVTPDNVAAAYNVSGVWTGQGQTIAIVDEGAATASDLNSFWATAGVSATQSAANVTSIPVAGGPPANGDTTETALDVEWAGALAPQAKIRLYLSANVLNCLPNIISDQRSNPSLSVVSISFGATENGLTRAAIASLQAEFAQLAAAGVSVFAASGDGGSNPNLNTGSFGANNVLAPEYPASDANVTGVGGTTLSFNSSFAATGEVAWNAISLQNAATGGGLSLLVAAPSYQTGTPSGTQRCVPDVAAIASGNNLGAFVFVGNAAKSIGGTSLATPVWAAVCAQLNQARAAVGLPTAGLLGPKLYPLAGTGAFHDITSGTNGQYSAGPGYDLCTGLGSPNVTNLIVALGGVPPPVITGQPQSVSVGLGVLFSFSVAATGGGTLSYQWSLNGTAIAGATGPSYVKGAAAAGDAGSYTVTVSNLTGSVTSSAATLTIAAPAAPAAASGGGGGGGGGAPGLWFYGALLLLTGIRQATRSRAV
jgi:kumamolisin